MNGTQIQAKIYGGYGKAANIVGTPYAQYRPNSASGALLNQIATINAAFDAKPDFSFSKANLYPTPIWYALLNGALAQPGDYFTGVGGTFFIAGMQPLLPIIAIGCNRTLTIYRPQQNSGAGLRPYGGETVANQVTLATAFPASVLQGSKGEKSMVNLPGDVRSPWWQVLLPNLPGAILLRNDDIITDDLSKRYKISSAEQSELGWRITAAEMET